MKSEFVFYLKKKGIVIKCKLIYRLNWTCLNSIISTNLSINTHLYMEHPTGKAGQ